MHGRRQGQTMVRRFKRHAGPQCVDKAEQGFYHAPVTFVLGDAMHTTTQRHYLEFLAAWERAPEPEPAPELDAAALAEAGIIIVPADEIEARRAAREREEARRYEFLQEAYLHLDGLRRRGALSSSAAALFHHLHERLFRPASCL